MSDSFIDTIQFEKNFPEIQHEYLHQIDWFDLLNSDVYNSKVDSQTMHGWVEVIGKHVSNPWTFCELSYTIIFSALEDCNLIRLIYL